MIVVKIKLWPGGNENAKRQLARIDMANISSLDDVSDYKFRATKVHSLDGLTSVLDTIGAVKRHARLSETVYSLVRKVLVQLCNQERRK